MIEPERVMNEVESNDVSHEEFLGAASSDTFEVVDCGMNHLPELIFAEGDRETRKVTDIHYYGLRPFHVTLMNFVLNPNTDYSYSDYKSWMEFSSLEIEPFNDYKNFAREGLTTQYNFEEFRKRALEFYKQDSMWAGFDIAFELFFTLLIEDKESGVKNLVIIPFSSVETKVNVMEWVNAIKSSEEVEVQIHESDEMVQLLGVNQDNTNPLPVGRIYGVNWYTYMLLEGIYQFEPQDVEFTSNYVGEGWFKFSAPFDVSDYAHGNSINIQLPFEMLRTTAIMGRSKTIPQVQEHFDGDTVDVYIKQYSECVRDYGLEYSTDIATGEFNNWGVVFEKPSVLEEDNENENDHNDDEENDNEQKDLINQIKSLFTAE